MTRTEVPKHLKIPPKFKYFKYNTSNIELRVSELLNSQISRKSLGKITSEEKKKKHLTLSGSVERSQKKRYFILSVIHTRSMDEVAEKQHVHCGLAARIEIVMAYCSDLLLG